MSSHSDTEVRRLIAEAMVPLHKRIAELERRVVELETENAELQYPSDDQRQLKFPSGDN